MKLSRLGTGLKIAVEDGPYANGAISELEPEVAWKLFKDRHVLLETCKRILIKLRERHPPTHPVVLMLMNAVGQAETEWASESPAAAEPPKLR